MRSCTASKAALLAVCQYPFSGRVEWVETSGKAAQDGNDFHERIAAVVDPSLPPVTRPITTKWMRSRLEHATTWVEANYVRGWRAEEAYAYDPETGTSTLLGHDIGRAYEQHGRKPGELAGSADIAWFDESEGCVFVKDWKTSRYLVPENVFPQLEWLALFAARHYGATRASIGALHVTESPVDDSCRRLLDRHGLNRIEDQLRANIRAIPDAWPTDGVHCDALYCPSRGGCDLYQIRKGKAA